MAELTPHGGTGLHDAEGRYRHHRPGLEADAFRDIFFYDDTKGVGGRVGFVRIAKDGSIVSPRHRHTFVNLRYHITGEMAYGKEIHGKGDLVYIPESVPYGPLSMSRPGMKRTEDYLVAHMQFIGTSGIPYLRPEVKQRGYEDLATRGEFNGGIFIHPDGRKQDSYEAIHEYLTGGVPYPPPRQASYLVVHEPNAPWKDLNGYAGVQVKHLGYFTEAGPNVKLVRLAAGAGTPAGSAPYQQARWILSGSVVYGGATYDALSVAYYPADASYATMTAESEVTMLVIQWATRDGDPPPFCTL